MTQKTEPLGIMIRNMKRMISAILILCGTLTAQAAQDEKNGTPFFTSEELPNIANFLPAPPEFESAAFVYDQTQHLWGKLQRLNEERAQMAINDAVYGMQTIIDIYGKMFGLDITKEDTPAIYKLLQDVACTCDSVTVRAKRHHMRLRPYVYYKEGTLVPEKEEKHAGEGSWPSGHTALGWTTALLLTDINPAATDGIMARAYEHGQSRVIAGYHWQTDVDAARLAASLLYIKLQGNERFQEQMAKAREEFREKTGAPAGISAPGSTQPVTSRARVYTLNGQPATSETRGIVIENNRKVIRK